MSEWFLQFLSHPIMVFVGAIGAVASIIGLPLAIYLFIRGNKRRGLTYKISPVRTQIVRARVASRLSVFHDGREVKSDITAAHIAIWNQGRQSIRQADMLRPLVIETENHAPILESTIHMETRDEIAFTLDKSKCDQGRLGVSWDILEKHDGGIDGGIVQIIYAGSPDLRIKASATPEGQRKIIDCSEIIPPVPGAERKIFFLIFFMCGLLFVEFATQTVNVAHFFQTTPIIRWGLSATWVGWLLAICAAMVGLCSVIILLNVLKLRRQVRPPFEF
jgi:hypothetical protein